MGKPISASGGVLETVEEHWTLAQVRGCFFSVDLIASVEFGGDS